MKNNILKLGYEALLQPTLAVRKRHVENPVMDAAKIYEMQVKFFGLDKLFLSNQKVK